MTERNQPHQSISEVSEAVTDAIERLPTPEHLSDEELVELHIAVAGLMRAVARFGVRVIDEQLIRQERES